MTSPITLTWRLSLPTTRLADAWTVFSDTDRFNRAAGFGFQFKQKAQADGTVVRIGHIRRFGLSIQWIEHPFELHAPYHFVSRRTFLNGPLAGVVTSMTLSENSEELVLDYQVELQPRSFLTAPLIRLDAARSLRPTLDRTLHEAIQQLENPSVDWGSSAPPLSESASRRVREQFTGRVLGEQFIALIERADLRDQNRIRPLALAKRWGVDPETVISECLEAVHANIFTLQWDLLCPSCLGAKVRVESLQLAPDEVHCSSCNIRYDGTIADSIEVTFKPIDAIRTLEIPVDCVFSPQERPHVIAQATIRPGEEISWRGVLETGAYHLELDAESTQSASIEVRPGLRAVGMAIDLTPTGLFPNILRVGPGSVEVSLRSRLSEDTLIRLERRWRPPNSLTAGQLLENPTAWSLLPESVLSASLEVTQREGFLLVIQAREERPKKPSTLHISEGLEARLSTQLLTPADSKSSEVPKVYTGDGIVTALYLDPDAMLRDLKALPKNERLAVIVHAGTFSIISDGEREVPVGKDYEQALQATRNLGEGRSGVCDTAASSPVLQRALEKANLELISDEALPISYLKIENSLHSGATDQPATVVGGRYTLGEEIGRGGFGLVLAAHDQKTGEALVIKSPLPSMSSDPANAQRFFWEARLASRIRHPNCVDIKDYGSEEGWMWMAMERLYGKELADRINQPPPLDWRAAVDIAVEALSGLHAAHELKIVHRDVKPENIFLCDESERQHIKLLDFGIAISLDDDFEVDPEVILGTPLYLSPEQVEGERLDRRTDIYSASLVIYEMISGNPTFTGSNALAVAYARLAKDPVPLSTKAPEVPKSICNVVMKGLAQKRRRRWKTALAMAEALKAAAAKA